MSVKSGESTGHVEVMPNGIPVFYQSAPKRLYRIGVTKVAIDPEFYESEMIALLAQAQDEARAAYWREVPSVTTVLGVLDKPALPYWGNKVGADGVLELVRRGLLVVVE